MKSQRNIEKNMDKKKVMIIEDEIDILLLYKDYLNNKGFSVLATSTTANEALKDYENFYPNMIILDYNLPGKLSGLEAAKQILTRYPSVPIIIVTAYETVKTEMANDRFFADKKVVLLLKPIKLHILEYTIKTLLE